jgi:hypothetical protein
MKALPAGCLQELDQVPGFQTVFYFPVVRVVKTIGTHQPRLEAVARVREISTAEERRTTEGWFDAADSQRVLRGVERVSVSSFLPW